MFYPLLEKKIYWAWNIPNIKHKFESLGLCWFAECEGTVRPLFKRLNPGPTKVEKEAKALWHEDIVLW